MVAFHAGAGGLAACHPWRAIGGEEGRKEMGKKKGRKGRRLIGGARLQRGRREQAHAGV